MLNMTLKVCALVYESSGDLGASTLPGSDGDQSWIWGVVRDVCDPASRACGVPRARRFQRIVYSDRIPKKPAPMVSASARQTEA